MDGQQQGGRLKTGERSSHITAAERLHEDEERRRRRSLLLLRLWWPWVYTYTQGRGTSTTTRQFSFPPDAVMRLLEIEYESNQNRQPDEKTHNSFISQHSSITTNGSRRKRIKTLNRSLSVPQRYHPHEGGPFFV